ncbi:MAG: hypothetical protein GEV06_14355 [Luteitalea sp.]|nr:hypothetical protein [Luteitalea sp.]
MNIVTKSGTNDFRGTTFEFHRNNALDANTLFANRSGLEGVDFRRNQFGINAGGPLVRGQTFFFAAYEGFRQEPPTRGCLRCRPLVNGRVTSLRRLLRTAA